MTQKDVLPGDATRFAAQYDEAPSLHQDALELFRRVNRLAALDEVPEHEFHKVAAAAIRSALLQTQQDAYRDGQDDTRAIHRTKLRRMAKTLSLTVQADADFAWAFETDEKTR